jgi:hypothetical protein
LQKSFIVFVIYTTAFVLIIMHELFIGDGNLDRIFYYILIGGWVLFGVVFALSRSIEKAVEAMKISLELKSSTQANVNAEVSQILKVLKTQGGKNEGY